MKPDTRCVHSGSFEDKQIGGINTPIFTSSAYKYMEQDEVLYPRYYNTPNQTVVVEKMAALEEGEDGVLFSSGMAAISTTLLAFARAGDHIVLMNELYGGTHFLASDAFERMGLSYTFTATDAAAVCQAVTDKTQLIIIESPTNPLLNVIDIRKVAEFARERGIMTMIDNTFASPINQLPLALGIDIVVHSGTKYLGGHSDMCCGVAVSSKSYAEKIRNMAKHLGGSLNALSCYMLERSLKTLSLRVQRQTDNAGRLAAYLNKHEKVSRVYYPGLPDSPAFEIARGQMKGFGGMLSFELTEGHIRPEGFLQKLRLIKTAVSLGGVESTICMPVMTSHAKMTAEQRREVGISDRLFRLSVGIEDAGDLIEDIEKAL